VPRSQILLYAVESATLEKMGVERARGARVSLRVIWSY
jgi:hypothetical protein